MVRNVVVWAVTGAWIGFSEFLRNELLFKFHWIAKYEELGLVFPSSMANNAVWGIWSLLLAAVILFLSRRLSLPETVAVSWISAFVLMWLTIGNLNVLPFRLLVAAVPLSVIEVFVAALICYRYNHRQAPGT